VAEADAKYWRRADEISEYLDLRTESSRVAGPVREEDAVRDEAPVRRRRLLMPERRSGGNRVREFDSHIGGFDAVIERHHMKVALAELIKLRRCDVVHEVTTVCSRRRRCRGGDGPARDRKHPAMRLRAQIRVRRRCRPTAVPTSCVPERSRDSRERQFDGSSLRHAPPTTHDTMSRRFVVEGRHAVISDVGICECDGSARRVVSLRIRDDLFMPLVRKKGSFIGA